MRCPVFKLLKNKLLAVKNIKIQNIKIKRALRPFSTKIKFSSSEDEEEYATADLNSIRRELRQQANIFAGIS